MNDKTQVKLSKIKVNDIIGTLTYNPIIIGLDANDCNLTCTSYAKICFDNGDEYELFVNGEEVYYETTEEYSPYFYYEVEGTDGLSDCIHDTIMHESQLIDLLLGNAEWQYI